MLNIVLVEPEIPQNCGNIARTCAATGARLHLIRPLGFDISEKAVRRAGLDYWDKLEIFDYENLADFFARNDVTEMWCLSTKAPRSYCEARYHDGCYLFFGKETGKRYIAFALCVQQHGNSGKLQIVQRFTNAVFDLTSLNNRIFLTKQKKVTAPLHIGTDHAHLHQCISGQLRIFGLFQQSFDFLDLR